MDSELELRCSNCKRCVSDIIHCIQNLINNHDSYVLECNNKELLLLYVKLLQYDNNCVNYYFYWLKRIDDHLKWLQYIPVADKEALCCVYVIKSKIWQCVVSC